MQRSLKWVLFFTIIAECLPIIGQSPKPTEDANVAGNWQISWEARIGKEQGAIQFQQIAGKISGKLKDRLGNPSFSGDIHGQTISFKIPFEKSHPFTLSFTGKVEGNTISGKFEIQDMTDGYDWHGENAHPTDYSWTATRETAPADRAKQNPSAAMEVSIPPN